MFEYEEVLENLISTFTTIDGIYHNSCKDLLDPLLLPESEKLDLLSNTGAKRWDDKELGERLQARLGDSYTPYTCCIRQLNKRVELFKKKLELNNEMKPRPTNKSGAREKFLRGPLRRIRLGLGAEKLEKLLSGIEKGVSRITQLTRGAYKLEPQSSTQKSAPSIKSKYWEEVRDHARRLFEVLVSRWRCNCDAPHRAGLQLASGQDENDTIFQMCFSFDMCSATLPWNWRDVSIQPTKIPSTRRHSTLLPPNSRKMVSFNPDSEPSSKSFDLTKPQQHLPPDIESHVSSYNLDEETPEQRKLATLRQLVTDRASFSPRQKYEVASALASAVLQLHSTPWMSDTWTMDDVYFIRSQTTSTHSRGPYVSKVFASNSAPPTPEPAVTKQPSTVHNPVVFALGVVLLELFFGPLESHITADDLDAQGKETLQTKYLVANRLMIDIQQLELPGYANAATRCVCCKFDAISTSLEMNNSSNVFVQG